MNAAATAPTYTADPRAIAQARAAAAKQANEAAIGKVAEDFEAFFASAYFEQMFSSIKPDPVTGGGEGESMFRSLMIQEYGKAVARQHSLGIADVVKRQLLQLQEQQ
ncbi:rod-binding protein [Dongia sedimenti]|uniref:Rod-binding protein n=1 Tax=Dongia sedimenti TaxID=3064282 RepID=A0ABU0YHF3_9PROT|nr:rod-binding protein [Rhodospirillaceae bacterium R-7]